MRTHLLSRKLTVIRRQTSLSWVLGIMMTIISCQCSSSRGSDSENVPDDELYEKRIQPHLERYCFECHAEKSKELKGNLRLDKYDLVLQGGNNGRAVTAGDSNSFLLRVIRYEEDDYKMPPRAKIPAAEIKEFERWVKSGALGPKKPKK